MTEEQRAKLEDAGYDVESALARFINNEDLFMSFLTKYVNDPNMAKAEEAINNGDYPEAYAAVHALKGITGNLGMTDVFEASKEYLAATKDKTEADGIADEAKEIFGRLKEKNEGAIALISSL